MVLWILTLGLAAYLFSELASEFQSSFLIFSQKRVCAQLRTISERLRGLEESLQVGVLPDTEHWNRLGELPKPWGSLTYTSVTELRQSGSSVIPTLRRFRELALKQRSAVSDSMAKASQAMGQSLVCTAIVPILSFLLSYLIPELQNSKALWIGVSVVATVLAMAGGIWVLKLSQEAQWARLKPHERGWLLLSQIAIERFLSKLRSGSSADLAWNSMMEMLMDQSKELALLWGISLYQEPQESNEALNPLEVSQSARRAVLQLGVSVKKAIQVSVLDGKPCLDRVEESLKVFENDYRACLDRELTMLPSRCLKPIFICLAPACLGLMAFSVALMWIEMGA